MEQLVSLSRRASAFSTSHGVFYCLFETVFAASEPDPKPRTRCMAFGTYDQVLLWIFRAMSNCANGYVRGLNGPLDPVDYYRFWMQALRRPDPQFTQPMWITAKGYTPPANQCHPLSPRKQKAPRSVATTFQMFGYPDTARRIAEGEEVLLDLHRDAPVLSSLCNPFDGATLPESWLVSCPHGVGEGDPSLAPKPVAGLSNLPSMKIYRLDRPGAFVALVDGFGSLTGRADEMLFEFIQGVALALEIRHTGAGAKALIAFQQKLASVVAVAPGSLRVTINKAVLLEAVLFRRHLEVMAEALGDSADHGDFSMTVPLSAIRSAGMSEILAALPAVSTYFTQARRRTTSKAPLKLAA